MCSDFRKPEMTTPSLYVRGIHALDRALPRPITVRRRQAIYWPSIWAQARRPDMGGSFCVNGFPSSGTNWLCQLVSRYFGVPIFEPWMRLMPTLAPQVFHLHRFVDTPAARTRTLYITRDGRDALVSRYMKLWPNPNDARPLRAFEAASGLTYDKSQVRAQLPAFIEWYFNETRFSAMNWAKHVRRARDMDLARLTFENLKRAPLDTLEPVFLRISGQQVDRCRLADVIDQMDFAKIRTLKTSHHKRKSQVGEWKTLFTRKAREVFADYAQDALEQMEYETSRDWVKMADK